MIDQAVIDRIFEATDIVEVIGEFVRLKRSGSSHIGLCPFHNEKTASFVVTESKKIWKCFGCGKAGNVASFIMEHESLSFPESIEWLGKRCGIEVQAEKASVVDLSDVQSFFVDKGKIQATQYMNMRGFKPETCTMFGVGYSPMENIIAEKAKNKDALCDLGILGKADGRFYDRFRGRITWPIHSVGGKVIGFAGRSNGTPKYINTPQTALYDKSKALFNIFHAKKFIKQEDKAYVMEGYTDVMRCWERDYKNSVASCGTALTEDQCLLIKRFTDNIILLYDGDSAGSKAINHAIPIILGVDMNVKVCVLKDCDPDEYLKLNIRLPQEIDWLDYYTKDEDLSSDPTYVSMLANEMIKLIRLIPDEIKRILYTRKLSEILNINEQHLGGRILLKGQEDQPIKVNTALEAHEKYIVWLLMCYGNTELPTTDGEVTTVRDFIISDLKNDGIEFTSPELKLIATEFDVGCPDLSYFARHSNQKVSSMVTKMISDDMYPKDSTTEMLINDVRHAVLSLKSIYVSDMKEKIQSDIKKAQETGDTTRCMDLLVLNSKYSQLSMRIGKELGRVII